jgi:hypothetical protein
MLVPPTPQQECWQHCSPQQMDEPAGQPMASPGAWGTANRAAQADAMLVSAIASTWAVPGMQCMLCTMPCGVPRHPPAPHISRLDPTLVGYNRDHGLNECISFQPCLADNREVVPRRPVDDLAQQLAWRFFTFLQPWQPGSLSWLHHHTRYWLGAWQSVVPLRCTKQPSQRENLRTTKVGPLSSVPLLAMRIIPMRPLPSSHASSSFRVAALGVRPVEWPGTQGLHARHDLMQTARFQVL